MKNAKSANNISDYKSITEVLLSIVNKQTIFFQRKYNLKNENIKVQATEMEMQSQIKIDLGLLKPYFASDLVQHFNFKAKWGEKIQLFYNPFG